MTGETLDLFAEPADPAPAAAPDAVAQLERLFTEASRKAVFKALTPERMVELCLAVAVIARDKSRAYARAHQGERLDSFNWINRNPGTAQACATLHAALLDVNSIAMSSP